MVVASYQPYTVTLCQLFTLSSPFPFFLFTSTPSFLLFFFFNDTATTEIYTLSLHDALPICLVPNHRSRKKPPNTPTAAPPTSFQTAEKYGSAACSCCAVFPSPGGSRFGTLIRSEEHTSELQSHSDLVCRLLLEKKKKKNHNHNTSDILVINQKVTMLYSGVSYFLR